MPRSSLLACFVLAPVLSSAAGDKVYLRASNDPQVGRVTEDNIEKVVISAGGVISGLTFAQKDVAKIEYALTPPEYMRAETLFSAGNYEEAAEAFRSALQARHHELLKQYILRGLGLALKNGGHDKEAMQVFEELLKKHQDTKFLPEVINALIQLYLKHDMLDKIEPLLKTLERYAPVLSVLLRGRISESRKEYTKAVEYYQKVLDQTGEEDEAYWEARGNLARVAFKQKQAAGFQRHLDELLRRSEAVPPAVMAETYYYAAQIEEERGHNQPEANNTALEYYLRVFILFNTPATKQLSAEACFRAGALAELIATRGEHQELKKEAQRLYMYCARNFADTEWAKNAAQRIKR